MTTLRNHQCQLCVFDRGRYQACSCNETLFTKQFYFKLCSMGAKFQKLIFKENGLWKFFPSMYISRCFTWKSSTFLLPQFKGVLKTASCWPDTQIILCFINYHTRKPVYGNAIGFMFFSIFIIWKVCLQKHRNHTLLHIMASLRNACMPYICIYSCTKFVTYLQTCIIICD